MITMRLVVCQLINTVVKMNIHLNKRWFQKGRNTLYHIAYTYTIYSSQYGDALNGYKKYARKWGARRARLFMNGVNEEDDNFQQMEADCYGYSRRM